MSDIIIYLFLVALGFFLGALTVTISNNLSHKKQDGSRTIAVGQKPSFEPPQEQKADPIPNTTYPDISATPVEPQADSIAHAVTSAPVVLPVEKPQKGFVAPPPVDMVQEINDILKEMALLGEPNADRIKIDPGSIPGCIRVCFRTTFWRNCRSGGS